MKIYIQLREYRDVYINKPHTFLLKDRSEFVLPYRSNKHIHGFMNITESILRKKLPGI